MTRRAGLTAPPRDHAPLPPLSGPLAEVRGGSNGLPGGRHATWARRRQATSVTTTAPPLNPPHQHLPPSFHGTLPSKCSLPPPASPSSLPRPGGEREFLPARVLQGSGAGHSPGRPRTTPSSAGMSSSAAPSTPRHSDADSWQTAFPGGVPWPLEDL